jgi:pyrroloquinoline quinone biosynthesis protein E
LDVNVLLGLVERGKQRRVRVRFWNTTSKYSTATPEALCPWPFERLYCLISVWFPAASSATRMSPRSARRLQEPASFASIWFGRDFQAFRQALDGNVPAFCRGCYRDNEN